MNPLLSGVRVLDLSRMLPGGVISQLLADLGADVEGRAPRVGEESRAFGVPVAGTTAGHAFLDRGKRSVALDLQDPHGVRAVLPSPRTPTWCSSRSVPASPTGSAWATTT